MSSPTAKKLPAAKSPRSGFISDTIAELKKVVWPTRRETTYLTVLVLVVAVTVGLVLGALDYGFSFVIEKVFIR